MGFGGRIFAAMYDPLMKKVERGGLAATRQEVVGTASGDVLEIGGGTGHNLPYYGSAVRSLTITEPEHAMLRRLAQHVGDSALQPTLLRAPAEDLPFDDASFDTVVSSLVLCTVDDQPRAVREIVRVLRPGGRLLLIEHVRSEDERTARLQDRVNWLNRIVAYGCNCNRATVDTLRAAGFDVTIDRGELSGAPKFVRPLVYGAASLRAPAATRAPVRGRGSASGDHRRQ